MMNELQQRDHTDTLTAKYNFNMYQRCIRFQEIV